MAKPSPDERQSAGERLLAEWGVPADAALPALAAVLHRDPAADLAIAHRLGAVASDDSAALLARLEREAPDKQVRKEAKRALYRLEQRGVRPVVAPAAPPQPATGPLIEGYVSPLDGRGDQLVWLVKPQAGGVAHLFAVINDPAGLREAAVSLISRKQLKAVRDELARKHDLRLVDIDWRYADFLMQRAFGWARASGERIEGDYPALRAQLTRQPAATDLPPAVLARIDAAALASPAALLAGSAALLEEPELRTWFLAREQIAAYLAELEGVRDSPLVLNRAQQEERFEDIIGRAIDGLFDAAARPAWARRLYEMGYFFAATRRPERALQAAAVAQALDAAGAPRDIAFCAQLVRASLAFYFQMAVQQAEEQQQSSLLVTPQQLRTRRERP